MTTELPSAVWLMVHHKARTPTLDTPRLEVVRASGDALSHGVEEHKVEGGGGEDQQWRQHYNDIRPHSSINYMTPTAFRRRFASTPNHELGEAVLAQSVVRTN